MEPMDPNDTLNDNLFRGAMERYEKARATHQLNEAVEALYNAIQLTTVPGLVPILAVEYSAVLKQLSIETYNNNKSWWQMKRI